MTNDPNGASGEAVPALTVTQRANALLTEYVAIEAEQARLSRVDHNDPQISALGERAIAIADALPKVFDPAGSVDHAAACILVEMMLQRHDWSRLDEIQFGEDDLESLAVLSALAGATTGIVREQTRRVLLKTGRDIGMEPPIDPMLDVVTRHKAWLAAYAAAPIAETSAAETMWLAANPDPAGDRLHADPPAPTTMAGALAAVRFVMEDGGFVQTAHGRILKQALAFLEGRAKA